MAYGTDHDVTLVHFWLGKNYHTGMIGEENDSLWSICSTPRVGQAVPGIRGI